MLTLFKFAIVKVFATVRNIYRKPVSAILTTVAILFYGFSIGSLFLIPSDIVPELVTAELLILGYVGITAFMGFIMLGNRNQQALFYATDAHYLFTMPFSQRQVFTYTFIRILGRSFLMGLLSLVMINAFSFGALPNNVVLIGYLLGVLVQIFLFTLADYLYLLGQQYPKLKFVGLIIIGVVVAIILAIVGFYYLRFGTNLQEMIRQFVESPLFNYVPIIGWMRFGLSSLYAGNLFGLGIASLLLVVADFVIFQLFINFKELSVEELLQDAEKATVLRAQKQKFGSLSTSNKIHKATIEFRQGAWALFDKNILLLKKARSFITFQDIVVVGMYLAIGYFLDIGFMGTNSMMLFWVMASIMQSSIADELRSFYIYLIPDKASTKMAAVLIPLLIKPLILVTVSTLGVVLIYQESFWTLLANLLQNLSMMLVMVAGNVVTVRIVREGTNLVVENFIRMGIVLAALIPTFIIIIIGYVVFLDLETVMTIVPFVMTLVNVGLSVGLIALCVPMLNKGV